jgi:putative tryptophan/tyrosine transport system substrate-binding protein
MNRRVFLIGSIVGVFASSLPAEAQRVGKVYRVGMLLAGERPTQVQALRQGLQELGYTEGQNVVVEVRHADGRFERLPAIAAELVRLKVDVIVATGSEGVQAAKNATRTVPIVMTYVGDPIGRGFVTSLAHPGGNITGVANLGDELDTKRLELLTEAVPRLSRIAVLWNPPQPAHAAQLKNLEVAAQSLGVELQPVAVTVSEDLTDAFAAILRERTSAVTMLGSLLHSQNLMRIAELARKAKLPAISYNLRFPEVGGLMAYAGKEEDIFRRATIYVDRILKGARPADLPIEQATTFELVINLKTAKALGLTIPPSLLLRADQVIDP